jgi:thiol:disulfide interchange protein
MVSEVVRAGSTAGAGDGSAANIAGVRRARLASFLAILAAALAGLAFPTAPLAAALPPTPEMASVELDVDRTAYAPGGAGRLVALLRIEDGWHVNSHQPSFEYLIPTTAELELPAGWEAATLSYPAGEMERFTFADEPLSVFQGEVPIVASFLVPASATAGEVSVRVKVTYQACNDTQCLPPVDHEQVASLRIGEGQPKESGYFARDRDAGGAAAPSRNDGAGRADGTGGGGAARAPESAPEPAPEAAPVSGRTLVWMVAVGLLGGLILNAMPCVLPVLSIKVFALVKHASLTRRQVATASLATTAGILVSFWALAAAAVLARRAGAAVGWGIHFQQPAFVALLAVIVVLFALNMWGIFEIRLPGRLADVAGSAPREGLAGHLFTGLFATLMATPCSAPFLGSAVGFALGQSAPVIFAIFTAVGLGMAAPYLLLAAWPGAAKLLPKPGAWMVRLKEVMGFLLAGAAVWLFYVLAQQVSAATLALVQLALLGLALAVWLARSVRSGWPLAAATVATLALAVAPVWLAAVGPPASRGALGQAPRGLIAWVPFERAEAERLAASGTPVFVDVTADWCVTCKVNERLVLDTPEVAGAFDRLGVVAMRADWTTRDRAIGEFLAEHGRYGIPFYVLYRPGGAPHVFPELITRDGVIGALEPVRRASR